MNKIHKKSLYTSSIRSNKKESLFNICHKKPTLNVIELVLNLNLMPIIDIKKYLKINHLSKEEKNYLILKYGIFG